MKKKAFFLIPSILKKKWNDFFAIVIQISLNLEKKLKTLMFHKYLNKLCIYTCEWDISKINSIFRFVIFLMNTYEYGNLMVTFDILHSKRFTFVDIA